MARPTKTSSIPTAPWTILLHINRKTTRAKSTDVITAVTATNVGPLLGTACGDNVMAVDAPADVKTDGYE